MLDKHCITELSPYICLEGDKRIKAKEAREATGSEVQPKASRI